VNKLTSAAQSGGWLLMLLVAAAVGLLALASRFAFKGPRSLRFGFVTGIIGRKGNGKSLFMVHEMLRSAGRRQRCEICSLDKGRSVYHRITVASNNRLRLPGGNPEHVTAYGDGDALPIVPVSSTYFVQLPDDGELIWKAILDLPHCSLVMVDELGMYCPATPSFVLGEAAKEVLSQCRKYGHEVHWCSQREDRVTVGVRSQTDLIGLCRRSYFKTMVVRFCEPEDIGLLRRRGTGGKQFQPVGVYRYRVSRKLGAAYSTFQRFRPNEGAAGRARDEHGGRTPSVEQN